VRTIAHLSDLHFGRVDSDTLDPLRAWLEALRPDLVVVSGDLTQRAKLGQFQAARAFLETLPKPQLVVPGNHDVPLYRVIERFAAPLGKYKRVMGDDLEPVFIDDELAAVGVNTARSTVFKGGRINAEQVERVRAILCPLPQSMTKILVTHHPFDVPKDSSEQDQIVGRARMALEKLAGCGADVFLSGHLHEASITRIADRYDIAGVHALVVQAGTTTSRRTRGTPNTFNVLRTSPDRVAIERHAWTGKAFACEASETYRRDSSGWHEG
jgi:3',5'-cyclic AMP phosphodiesterase CpdA